MGFSKSYGPVSISESQGNFTFAIDDSVKVGGGSVEGVISVSGQGSATLEAGVLVDAGLAAAEAKYPSLAAEIAVLKDMIDSEIAKA